MNRSTVSVIVLTCALAGLSPVTLAQDGAPAVSLGVTYTGDIWANTSGGLRTGEKYLDNLDLTASIDAEKAFNIPGGTFFFYGLYNNNTTLSDTLLGDLQTASNIDTTTAFRLYEAWYEQVFADERGSFKVGLYDLNSEFDAIDAAGLFLNSSHGIGPDFSQTGQNGPSIFPVTSLGARLQFQLNDSVLLRAAILDGVPGSLGHTRRTAIKLGNGAGALMVGEIEADRDGTVAAIGVWNYTSDFDHVLDVDRTGAPLRQGGNRGMYVEAERKFADAPEDPGLAIFGRLGFAESELNQLSRAAGAGVSYQGLLADRPDDTLGLAIAHATNGSPFRSAARLAGSPVGKSETNFELTYRAPVTEWLTVQPDAQWIINPGTDPGLKNAFAVGLRFEISFGRDF